VQIIAVDFNLPNDLATGASTFQSVRLQGQETSELPDSRKIGQEKPRKSSGLIQSEKIDEGWSWHCLRLPFVYVQVI